MPHSIINLTENSSVPKPVSPAVHFYKKLNWAFMCAGLLAMAGLIAVCYCKDINKVVLFIIALAGFATGSIIGFLFGIPRTLQKTTTGGKTEVVDNTNLEQISDWLTKILVGVGLTQIQEIKYNFYLLSSQAGEAITGSDTIAATTFSGAIIIFFALDGFLVTYLWTRLELTEIQKRNVNEAMKGEIKEEMKGELKDEIDSRIIESSGNLLEETQKQLSGRDDNNKNAITIAFRQLNHSADTPDITADEMYEILKLASGKTISDVYIMAVNYRKQNWETSPECVSKTIPIFQALIRLDTKNDYPENYSQFGYVLKDKKEPDYTAAIENFDKAIAAFTEKGITQGLGMIYFNRALSRIELQTQNGTDSDAETISAIKADIEIAKNDVLVKRIIETSDTIAKWEQRNTE